MRALSMTGSPTTSTTSRSARSRTPRSHRPPSSSRSRPPASTPSTGSSSAAVSTSSCPPSSPSSPGWDVAGTVVGLGFDTPEFEIGDEVVAYARKDVLGGGTFAEKVAVPVHAVTKKPAGLTWEQAGGAPLAGNTALRTLDALGDLDGKTVLIHGAAGGVGSMAVQIAKAAGARVIGTASERNHHYLRGLGAEPITYGEGLADRVRELADGPVDAVADFVGGQLETTLAVLADDGAHASIADPTVTTHGGRYIWVRPDGATTARLTELVDAGKLSVEVDQIFPSPRWPTPSARVLKGIPAASSSSSPEVLDLRRETERRGRGGPRSRRTTSGRPAGLIRRRIHHPERRVDPHGRGLLRPVRMKRGDDVGPPADVLSLARLTIRREDSGRAAKSRSWMRMRSGSLIAKAMWKSMSVRRVEPASAGEG